MAPRTRNARSSRSAEPARSGRGARASGGRALRRASVAVGVLLVAVGGAWISIRRHAAQIDLRAVPGQNVLLITIDTLRADALGAYGGRVSTPALDRLAQAGVRFDFAHAHAVLTLPSHASILTGLYPYQHGVRENSGYRLAPDAHTAATLLKAAGYATGAFVGAFPLHSRFGLNVGFDVYEDRFGETRAPTEFVMPERPATEVVALARKWIAGRARHDSASNQQSAINQQSTISNQQWFCWVHVFDPHAPYRPPPPFDAQYAERPYYGEVAATDAALAPLLDDVRASARPTFVVVTGDHGEALGDHGEQSHGLFAYESTLRIPLIIAEFGGARTTQTAQSPHSSDHQSFFGRFAAFAFSGGEEGEVSHVAARHVDILPTLLDAVGLPIPAGLPGRSLLTAAGRHESAPRPSYFEAMSAMLNRGWAPLTGILIDRDKYIDLPIAERYDLAADPGETSNLAGRSPERDRTLAAALGALGAALPGQRRTEDADAIARLRALGYVSGSAPVKTHYTEADDPKRLVDLDGAIHDAVEAYGAGRSAEAVEIYKRVIGRRPDMAIAYKHLAFVEWQRGNVRDAIAALQRAVQAGVTYAGVLTQLGTYLAETGHAVEAIQMLEPLARDPGADADTLNALGIALARAGRAQQAADVFRRVLNINPESSMPLENLGVLALERGDYGEARQYFERAIAADPRSSQAHADLGVVLLKAGERKAAIAEWTRAVDLDPTNYDALYNVATTLVHDGQLAAARPYLEQFARTAPRAFYEKDIRKVRALLERH